MSFSRLFNSNFSSAALIGEAVGTFLFYFVYRILKDNNTFNSRPKYYNLISFSLAYFLGMLVSLGISDLASPTYGSATLNPYIVFTLSLMAIKTISNYAIYLILVQIGGILAAVLFSEIVKKLYYKIELYTEKESIPMFIFPVLAFFLFSGIIFVFVLNPTTYGLGTGLKIMILLAINALAFAFFKKPLINLGMHVQIFGKKWDKKIFLTYIFQELLVFIALALSTVIFYIIATKVTSLLSYEI